MCVGTVASVVALRGLNDARVLLTDELSPAAITAADLKAALVDQETGVRGFTLTGEQRFLEPYTTGRRQTTRAIEQLERLASHDGMRQLGPQVDAVTAAARAWETGYAIPTIALVRRDPEAAREPSAVGAGKAALRRVPSRARAPAGADRAGAGRRP